MGSAQAATQVANWDFKTRLNEMFRLLHFQEFVGVLVQCRNLFYGDM